MANQVSSICQKMFFQIRNISFNRKYLPQQVIVQLMVSLVLSKLDYCNSLLSGIPDSLISRLQRAQNCAARVCMGKRKYDSAKPLLQHLHWLPVKERIKYKIALLCFKCIHNCAPTYLQELIHINVKSRNLRSSSDKNILFKPIKKLKTYGDKSFDFYGPHVWNSLPRAIRDLENINDFKRALKTHLFTQAFYS